MNEEKAGEHGTEQDRRQCLEERLSGEASPLSRVALNDLAQSTFDYIFGILEQGSGFGETPEERFSALEAEILKGDTITPETIRNLKEEYERIGKVGESRLYGFVEDFFLKPMRTGLLTGREHRPKMIYEVYGTCPVDGHQIEKQHPVRRETLEKYRGADFDLAFLLTTCETCQDSHDPSLSRMRYDFGLVAKYTHLHENAENAEREFRKVLRKKRIPDNPFINEKSPGLSYTRQEQNAWKRKYGEEYRRLKRQRDRKVEQFQRFCKQHDILEIYSRVKGDDRFIRKVADNVWDLRGIVDMERDKIKDKDYPTAIKDYLGVKIIVSDEHAMEKVIGYIHDECAKFTATTPQGSAPNLYMEPGTEKNYWGEPVFRETDEGKKVLVRGRKEKNGQVVFEAWKTVLNYCGMDIELQVQTKPMWNRDRQTHNPYEEFTKNRRVIAEKRFNIPYERTVQLFDRILRQAT